MATIRVSDPVQLVKILPYQLGYHPAHSLVAVGLRGRQLVLVQRVDLPTDPGAVSAAADVMAGHLRTAGCTAALVVVFEDRAEASQPGDSTKRTEQDGAADPNPGRSGGPPARRHGLAGRQPDGRPASDGPASGPAIEGPAAGALLAARIGGAGIPVAEHLVVRGGRVYFPGCPGSCHPDAGVPLPEDRDVAPVADFVALGVSPCATRDGLAQRVAAADNRTARAIRVAARRMGRQGKPAASPQRALPDWGRFLDAAGPGLAQAAPSAAAAARMAASLADVSVRDLLLTWLCPGTLDPQAFDPRLVSLARAFLPGGFPALGEEGVAAAERSAALVERLCWLARHAPSDLAPGVLTLLAAYAWWLGDGALASTALDRALSVDPAYRLARLLEQLVGLGVAPPRAGVQGLDSGHTPQGRSV